MLDRLFEFCFGIPVYLRQDFRYVALFQIYPYYLYMPSLTYPISLRGPLTYGALQIAKANLVQQKSNLFKIWSLFFFFKIQKLPSSSSSHCYICSSKNPSPKETRKV
eukprot:TRINITY_DN33803_c2_g1_i1.p1 TRINITY_DN33803_c2_g1~~TRINITY_DN33803_c2_g1_i1.p1  ORF type:complete len:107 (+),score=6.57 TRINITY_DN33803_c2_g1_i1:709-1029(+)